MPLVTLVAAIGLFEESIYRKDRTILETSLAQLRPDWTGPVTTLLTLQTPIAFGEILALP